MQISVLLNLVEMGELKIGIYFCVVLVSALSTLADHRRYVSQNDTSKATGAHFSSPGHTLSNMKITALEKKI